VAAKGSSSYRSYAVWSVLYVLLMTGITGSGFYARSWAVAVYGSPQAQSEWNRWRAEAAKLAAEGPVKRRVPKSDKPPALVLATAYFGVCLAIALLLTTVLFWTAAYFALGVMRSPGRGRA
jgi:hypothetical protein